MPTGRLPRPQSAVTVPLSLPVLLLLQPLQRQHLLPLPPQRLLPHLLP